MNTTKSQKAKLTFDGMQNIKGIKLVKNAIVLQKDGIYFCKHYDTIIFAYDPKSQRVEANWHCSTTSDRMIRNCIQFFNLDESKVINTHDGAKWNYSRPLA